MLCVTSAKFREGLLIGLRSSGVMVMVRVMIRIMVVVRVRVVRVRVRVRVRIRGCTPGGIVLPLRSCVRGC